MSIYVQHNGQQLGPFTEDQLKAQLAAGAISLQDHVWWDGQKDWIPLGQSPYGGAPGATVITPGTSAAAAYTANVAPTSKFAIWALVLGCSSVICNIFTAIPAIILGHMSLKEIKKNPGMQGYGMGLAGTILGYVFTAFGLLYIGIVGLSVLIALGNQVKSTTSDTTTPPAITSTNSDATPSAPSDTTNAPAKE